MLQIKFVLNTFFHDVLDDRSPARHLVSLFSDTLLTCYLVNFLSVTLETVCHESHTMNWTFYNFWEISWTWPSALLYTVTVLISTDFCLRRTGIYPWITEICKPLTRTYVRMYVRVCVCVCVCARARACISSCKAQSQYIKVVITAFTQIKTTIFSFWENTYMERV
jgi:hypothetical protein